MLIECKCGCGVLIEDTDRWNRKRVYISGHNTPKKYDDPKQYKREWNYRNRQSRSAYKKRWILNIKIGLIHDKGDKCKNCGTGFNGINSCIFDLHHRNPAEKDFNLNLNFINQYRKELILKEAEKCDLLCSNCHRLEHFEGKRNDNI